MKLIGTPPNTVGHWLLRAAEENEAEANRCVLPWNRAKYRARADAFLQAYSLWRRSVGEDA